MVFLQVLKIIGFVLLGIIALILLILLTVLFWPFFYKIGGSYRGELKAKAVVSFFFSFIRAILSYENGEPLLQVKVLWFTVYKDDFSEEEEELPDYDSALDDTEIIDIAGADHEKPDNAEPPEGEDDSEEETSGEDGNPEGDEEGPGELTDEEIAEFMEEALPKRTLEEQIHDFFDSVKKAFQNLKEKWYNLKRKGHNIEKKVRYYQKLIKYYYRVLHHPSMEPAFKMVKKTIKGLIKHVRPRKLRVYVHYGADNPADTANAVAMYSMIYTYFPKQIKFDAEFEKKIFEADGYIKGRFQVGILGFYLVRAYFNKHIRKMIKLFTREGKKNGRTK